MKACWLGLESIPSKNDSLQREPCEYVDYVEFLSLSEEGYIISYMLKSTLTYEHHRGHIPKKSEVPISFEFI